MTTEQFTPLYEEYLQSGLSRKAFAQEKEISYSVFGYWARKFRRAESEIEPEFLELSPTPENFAETDDRFEIVLSSGNSVFVPPSFDAKSLNSILTVLQG